jgi:hypothetical protein
VIAAIATYALVLLQGFVTIGPTSAQCYGHPSCSKPAAHLLIIFTRAGHYSYATTDRYGHYELRLSPGTWTASGTAGVGTTPGKIIVRSVRSMKRNFTIDTGIR